MRTQENVAPGKLITFEGIDAAGKTSIVKRLAARLSSKAPVLVCGERRSPFWKLLRNKELKSMTAFLKTYLFAADRAWTYERECFPALKRGCLVLWDRYVDSALAYRAVELAMKKEQLDLEFVKTINKPFRTPDLIFLIDISLRTYEERNHGRAGTSPYATEFLRNVRKEYKRLARQRAYIIVDGERPLSTVADEIVSHIKGRFEELFTSCGC